MMIRKATHEDALDILSIYAPFVRESAITFEYDVPGVEVMAERIVSYSEKFPWLVAEVDGQIAGYAYATSYRERKAYQWSCEASVYVADPFRGTGVAGALYDQLFDKLRRQGLRTVYAVITLPNPASEKFHARHGFSTFAVFRNTGYKLGNWHDVLWMEKQLLPYDPNMPDAPLPPGD